MLDHIIYLFKSVTNFATSLLVLNNFNNNSKKKLQIIKLTNFILNDKT